MSEKVGYKNPPKHSQFKKGKVANPEGGRTHNPATRALKNLTVESYREVIELVLTGRVQDLRAMAENPETPAIQVAVATSFLRAIREGDYTIVERIAERLVGKIPDEINLRALNVNANLNAKVDKDMLKAAMAALDDDV